MTSSYEETGEEKDRTKLIWLGVVVLVVVMIGALWMTGSMQTAHTSVVRARHILITFDKSNPTERIQALEMITKIRDRILDGESFKKLARTYSDDPGSARRGGDLGYFERGAMVKEFDAYVWKAPLNELSEVVETKFGFHLIEVLDRKLSKKDAFKAAQ